MGARSGPKRGRGLLSEASTHIILTARETAALLPNPAPNADLGPNEICGRMLATLGTPNGTGGYTVSSIIAAPEPGTLPLAGALLAAGAVGAVAQRRKAQRA